MKRIAIKSIVAAALLGIIGATSAAPVRPVGDGIVISKGTSSRGSVVGVQLENGTKTTVLVDSSELVMFALTDEVRVSYDPDSGTRAVQTRVNAPSFAVLPVCADAAHGLAADERLIFVPSTTVREALQDATDATSCWSRIGHLGTGGYTAAGLVLARRGESANEYQVYAGGQGLGVTVIRVEAADVDAHDIAMR